MTLETIINLISFRLGNRKGLDSQIIAEINLQQVELERSGDDLPWFLEVRDEELVVTSTQNKALPTGFLRMISVFKTTTEYEKFPREKLKLEAAKGCAAYALSKSTLYLPDEDDDGVTLEIDYYKEDTVLAAGTDTNGWTDNAPGILIGLAGAKIAKFLRDVEAVGLFQEEVAEAKARLIKEIVAREEAGGKRELERYA